MAKGIVVHVLADTSGLERGLKRARSESEGFGGSIGKLRIGIGQLVKSELIIMAVEKAVEGLREAFHAGIEEVNERAKAEAQLQAVLKSTGGIANVTAESVDGLAKSLSNLSGVDDEVIKAGETVLLGFTNIRNYAGAGNDIFDQATKAALDFSSRTGKSMQTASQSIGRALQDPAKAAQSLRRAQVVLTGAEKEGIAAAVKHGETIKAQQLILAAVEKRYRGAAAAAGSTFGGQLNILRERVKDISGDMLSVFVPSFGKGVAAISQFAVRLEAAKGLKARLRVALEGAESLGRSIANYVADATRAALTYLRSGRLQNTARRLGARVGDALRSVDWVGEITKLARFISRALVDGLNKIVDLRDSVDWERVGKSIVDGLAAAIGAVLLFLSQLDWKGIAKAIVRYMRSAVRQTVGLLKGIGGEIAHLLWQGLGPALTALGTSIERKGIELVLKLIHPFTLLPKWLGGGWARSLRDSLEGTLRNISRPAREVGAAAATGISDGYTQGMIAAANSMDASTKKAVTKADKAARDVGADPSTAPSVPGATPPKKRTHAELVAMRRAWFDNDVTRMLDRAQDLPLARQIARLKEIRAQIDQRAAVTKDITRKLNLEDRAIEVGRTIKGLLDQQHQNVIDARQAAATRRQASQYRALGLTGAGDERAPGLRSLRSEARRISGALEGTFLDTRKTHSVLDRISGVLKGKFGALTRDTRLKVRELLDGIDQELKGHKAVDWTSYRTLDADRFIAAAGLHNLSARQRRGIQATLAVTGPHNMVGTGVSVPFGGVHYHGDIHVAANNPREFEEALNRRDKARPKRRRGA